MEDLVIPLAMAMAIGPAEAWPLLDLLRKSAATGHRPIWTSYAQLASSWRCTKSEARTRLQVLVDCGAVLRHARRKGKRIEGLTLRVWRPDPAPQPKPRRSPRPPQKRAPGKPAGPSLPEWAQRLRVPKGETPLSLAQAITGIVDSIAWPECDRPPSGQFGRTKPWASKADAGSVLALLRASDESLSDFVAAMGRIARWARESHDGQAAGDIRGEDRPNGTDRSRSVATICVQRRYSERKQLAGRWTAAQQPSQKSSTGAAPVPVSLRDRR